MCLTRTKPGPNGMYRRSILAGKIAQQRFQIIAELIPIGNKVTQCWFGHYNKGPSLQTKVIQHLIFPSYGYRKSVAGKRIFTLKNACLFNLKGGRPKGIDLHHS
jgi:hypothetical protein